MALTRVQINNISSSRQTIVEAGITLLPGASVNLRNSFTLKEIANFFSLQKMLDDKSVSCEMTKENEAMTFYDSDNFQSVLLESRIEELELDGASAFNEEIGEPVGFLDASQTLLTINDAARTLTLSAVSGSYIYYVEGRKLVGTTPKTAVWPNIEGLHFFYVSGDGTLQSQLGFTQDIITKKAVTSVVYWDAANSRHIYFADERHGAKMATQTHLYLHNTQGAKFDRGLGLVGFSVDGGGGSNAHAQFTSVSGIIWDEDIRFPIPAQAQIPIFYRSGASNWRRKDADAYPVIYNGTAGYSSPRLPYNFYNGSSWSLTQVDNNKFVLVHIFATNAFEHPVVGVLGSNQYGSKSAARDGARTELQTLSGLPFSEFAPLGTVIFETSDSYTNVPKAQIVSIDGANYYDTRSDYFRPDTL